MKRKKGLSAILLLVTIFSTIGIGWVVWVTLQSGLQPRQGLSGMELLVGFTPPTISYEVLTFEYREEGWHNDFNITNLGSDWHFEIEVADLDGGNDLETMIAEASGLLVFKDQSGTMELLYNLTHPTKGGAQSFEVGDFDNDGSTDQEILACHWDTVAIWKKVSGNYTLYWNQTLPNVTWSVAAGNLDADNDLEFVVGVHGHVSGQLLTVMLFEHQVGTWQNVANYTDFQQLSYEFDKVDINDVDNDGTNEVIALTWEEPLQVLEYTDGSLVNSWTAPFQGFSHGFITGDVTNDGNVDIVLSEYRNYKILAIFETVSGTITHTYNIPIADLGADATYNMDIGDVDLDGLKELVYVEQGSPTTNKLRIFRHNIQICSKEIGLNCLSVEIGDYDNDANNSPSNSHQSQQIREFSNANNCYPQETERQKLKPAKT